MASTQHDAPTPGAEHADRDFLTPRTRELLEHLETNLDARETWQRFEADEHARLRLALETGSLDLRIDEAPVRVVTWEKNTYHVRVLQTPIEDTQVAPGETEVTLEASSSGSTLDLTVVVDREGPGGPTASVEGTETGVADPDRAIVA